MGLCLWRRRAGEKIPHLGFSELRDSGTFSSQCVAIAPSHCRIGMHRRSLIRQTQTDRTLISRVHGGRTHDVRTIQRNIEYDTQPGTFNCGKRSAGICVVFGSKKSSTHSGEYASGFFEPACLCGARRQAVSHLPASPSPRNEGLPRQTPNSG